jgi:hypothetical protein
MSQNNDDKFDNLKDDLHEIDKKVELIGQRLLTHLEQDERNLQGVKEAMESNRLLREQMEIDKQKLGDRITNLEDIPKWFKTTLLVITTIGTIAGAIIGIRNLF